MTAHLLSLNKRELSAYLDGKGKTVAADLLDFGAAHRYRPFPSLEGTGVVASVLDYLAERRPDTSPALLSWAALTLCGALLGAKVYAAPWRRSLRPNLFLLVVAPSGAGKGDLLGDVEELYVAVLPDHLLPDRFSSAGLADVLRAKVYGLAVIDEGDELLKRTRMDAFADTIGMLCRSYDGRVTREAIRSRETETDGPTHVAPSLLVAIQPSALQAGVIDTSHVLSGLLSRAVVVAAERPRDRVLLNEGTQTAVQGPVVAGLHRMAQLAGWSRIEQTAMPALAMLRAELDREEPSEELAGAWSRVPALAVKLATILQASMQAGDRPKGPAPEPIGAAAMTVAMELALWSWAETRRVFGEDVTYSVGEGKLQRLLRAVRQRGGAVVPSGDVLRALTGVTADEMRRLIDTLEERGELRVDTKVSSRGGRPAKLLTLVEGTPR